MKNSILKYLMSAVLAFNPIVVSAQHLSLSSLSETIRFFEETKEKSLLSTNSYKDAYSQSNQVISLLSVNQRGELYQFNGLNISEVIQKGQSKFWQVMVQPENVYYLAYSNSDNQFSGVELKPSMHAVGYGYARRFGDKPLNGQQFSAGYYTSLMMYATRVEYDFAGGGNGWIVDTQESNFKGGMFVAKEDVRFFIDYDSFLDKKAIGLKIYFN